MQEDEVQDFIGVPYNFRKFFKKTSIVPFRRQRKPRWREKEAVDFKGELLTAWSNEQIHLTHLLAYLKERHILPQRIINKSIST
ncbi:Protein of unknown function, partial [Gryllus bimaculatus]